MMEERVLALYLDGPLQSWGYQSLFDRRTTLSYPTRSGIIGMICAAMGVDRTDTDALNQFRRVPLKIYTFQQEGRLTDFHTVGGGYDTQEQQQNVVRTAEGKTGRTVVTHRDFLQGAKFAAILGGRKELLEKFERALRNPRWGIWMGRKCCIPASPVCQGLFVSEKDALGHLTSVIGTTPSRAVLETRSFTEGTDTIMDIPLDFDRRSFAPRRVIDNPQED